MCFSAEASFVSASVLGVIGLATLAKVKNPRHYLLALIPLFFGLQQFFEGLVWIGLEFAQYGYLYFAYLIWPVWVPLSLYYLEKEPGRRSLILIFLLLGFLVSAIDFVSLIVYPPESKVVNCSIQYMAVQLPFKLIYGLVVVIPCFISSVKWMWAFGLAIAISFGVAEYFYQATFTSVWCFFAAWISLMCYAIVTSLER